MNPEDVPMVEGGPVPSHRVTLQYFEPPDGVDSVRPRDAVFTRTRRTRDGNEPPPAILLDFMYGAAAFKRWGVRQEMASVLRQNFEDTYASLEPRLPSRLDYSDD